MENFELVNREVVYTEMMDSEALNTEMAIIEIVKRDMMARESLNLFKSIPRMQSMVCVCIFLDVFSIIYTSAFLLYVGGKSIFGWILAIFCCIFMILSIMYTNFLESLDEQRNHIPRILLEFVTNFIIFITLVLLINAWSFLFWEFPETFTYDY